MMGHKNGRKRQLHTLRSLLRGRKGATLVELVITFALIGLFAAGTCQIISTSIKVYHQVRGLNNARQVSDTLLEKITGEIEDPRRQDRRGRGRRSLPHQRGLP